MKTKSNHDGAWGCLICLALVFVLWFLVGAGLALGRRVVAG